MPDFAIARRNMVDCQLRTCEVTDRAVVFAFEMVERERFLPANLAAIAYLDKECDVGLVGQGQASRRTLAPVVLARLVQAARPTETERVLDVACGLGLSSAILAQLAGEVIGLEADAGLAADAGRRLAAAGLANTRVVSGDLTDPPAALGAFDVILVNGSLPTRPAVLTARLAEGGRLLCVIGEGRGGRATMIVKRGETFAERVLFDAAAPPLEAFRLKPSFAF